MSHSKQSELTPQQQQEMLVRQVVGDFKVFLTLVWRHLNLPDPTPVQYDIADYLQDYTKNRKIVQAFRGVGKSWITSAYVCWILLRNPQAKVLVVSASKQRSDDFSTFTQRLIQEVPILAKLKPRDNQRQSKVSFDVGQARPAHAPSVKSLGITSQLTGSRANYIIADDVEVVNNSATQDLRDALLMKVLEFEAILVPDDPKAQVIYLGTPQTEESIYNKLSDRGYHRRIWSALYPSFEQMVKYNNQLAPWITKAVELDPRVIGETTDPRRFSTAELLERQAKYGRSGFSLQFMLDTSLSDAEKYPLKTSDLIVFPLDKFKAPITLSWSSDKRHMIEKFPCVGLAGDRWYAPMYADEKWTEYEGAVMAIDPGGRGSDETAYAIVKQLHGKLFVMDVGGFKGGYEDATLVKLAEKAKEFKVNFIVIESNFGDGMFSKVLSPILRHIYPCTLEEVRHSTQKEKRIIDTLEPVMNQHRLVMNQELIERDIKNINDELESNYSLFYQMTRLTGTKGALKHDDKLDALAMAVKYFLESMGRSIQDAIEDFNQRELDEQLENFLNACHSVERNNLGSVGNDTLWARSYGR